jgi:hypothetical protein
MDIQTKEKRKFKTLFFDNYPYRHSQFRVRSTHPENVSIWQRHAHNVAEFKVALAEGDFEVIFIPGFTETQALTKEMVSALLTLPLEHRPKLLVCHGTSDIDNILTPLRSNNYLVAHIPWDFVTPTSHERKS